MFQVNSCFIIAVWQSLQTPNQLIWISPQQLYFKHLVKFLCVTKKSSNSASPMDCINPVKSKCSYVITLCVFSL